MKLDTKRTIFVGFAFFLICAFWQAYDTIIPKILMYKFGLSHTASGAVMAIDNVLALFMLPLFGTLSDKCKNKMGRRTPFILIGTILAVICFVSMSFADNAQLKSLEKVAHDGESARIELYDANLSFTTPEGEKVDLCEEMTKDEFVAIEMYEEDGKTVTSEYTNYVTPALQAYAHKVTSQNPGKLILFMSLLFLTLVSMATFRSPAVALMPDVTIKPLRSKANSIINLMGAVGGILVLILGIVFGTGLTHNALMSYTIFFGVIALVMVISLVIFRLKVNEPKFAAEMQEQSKELGIIETTEEEENSGSKKLSKPELRSLFFILASVVLWFMGYNAVTSKYSTYASAVLNLDYNTTLTIATGAAIISYVPVGLIATKIGRKKTILAGIIMLGSAFLIASFMRSGSPMLLMNVLFALAGIGWATINVNSYPMVVEMCKGGDVGRYTGFYYTASMAAQTVTPILCGVLMDIKMTLMFVYATVFVLLAFVTMMFVRHGEAKKDLLEAKEEVPSSDAE